MASPHLWLLIVWKVKTQSLSENPIPQMKAPPPAPHHMPGPWPSHAWVGGGKVITTSSLTQRYPWVSLSPEAEQATTRLMPPESPLPQVWHMHLVSQQDQGPRMAKGPFPQLPTRLQCSKVNVGQPLVNLPVMGPQFSLLGKMLPILYLVSRDSPLSCCRLSI